MKLMKNSKADIRRLVCVTCAAFALALAGCKEGTEVGGGDEKSATTVGAGTGESAATVTSNAVDASSPEGTNSVAPPNSDDTDSDDADSQPNDGDYIAGGGC